MNEKVEFLKKVKPFDLLPMEALLAVAEILEESKIRQEAVIYLQDFTKLKGIDIIIEGSYEAFFYDSEKNKRLIDQLNPQDIYGGVSILLNRRRSIRTVIARKGTRIYFLNRKDFKALCLAYKDFFHHFTDAYGNRMIDDEFAHFVKTKNASDNSYIASDLFFSRKIETITPREVVSCNPQTPIYKVAQLMAEKKSSCVFVENGKDNYIGYVTDITLRDNVVANQVALNLPIKDFVDNPIITISSEAFVYEAILMMFRTKTRYLLVQDNLKYLGTISRNKILTDQAHSPFVFIQSVKLAVSVKELKRKWTRVPEIVCQLLDRGVRAEIVNQLITSISDTILYKVIEGTIDELGEPPAKFCFIVLGSEGRKEQTLKTDQDNAIIYEDKANEQRELVREYFLNLASIVSEKLDNIGFSYCSGGLMAKNPKWTHSLSHWKNNYDNWINEPIPESVMNYSTFFDNRFIFGEAHLLEDLKEFISHQLKEPSEVFLYHLAKNALLYQTPLTFFNNFKTFTKGEKNVFDLKKTMTPIVDLVRVYALKNRIFKTNTGERIQLLLENKIFTEPEYNELLQAYYYLMGMRLKIQARQIMKDNLPPNNFLDPSLLTKVEQVTLKEIFKVIENFQLKIKIEFTRSFV
ncbi:MAG: DUF294 nucleotidyltransferase-like domain-containing protein [Bacteroidota bacterium]|nr:DUF294 nucleotidyltransferase-like domain-containing protein [Bacteroidota bacterium]